MEIFNNEQSRLYKSFVVLVIILAAYFAVKIIYEVKKVGLEGESATPATISFSGHGEVDAVPDIANVSFTISKDDTTVKAAQADVATVEKNSLDFLKSKNIADADIQTADVSVNPKYQNEKSVCPLIPIPMNVGVSGGAVNQPAPYYCPPSGNQVIVGYTASESITVKVRNTDNVGAIMQGLGIAGISNLSGPDFAIDNPEAVQAQARKLAIDDAKAKAEALAKDLGVSLGKITSFSENGNSPMPIMYASAMASGAPQAPAPAVIPAGTNTITSDVTITYEIR